MESYLEGGRKKKSPKKDLVKFLLGALSESGAASSVSDSGRFSTDGIPAGIPAGIPSMEKRPEFH